MKHSKFMADLFEDVSRKGMSKILGGNYDPQDIHNNGQICDAINGAIRCDVINVGTSCLLINQNGSCKLTNLVTGCAN